MEVLQNIYRHKLVAIIRGISTSYIIDIANALYEGGIRNMEITVNTPGVFQSIERIRKVYDGKMNVGAGTVLDAETARIAITAGSQFIVSPNTDEATIKLTKRYGVTSIPGAMTPTEILTAFESGGDIIKIFPATTLGPGYIKDIKGPLPHIPVMPTGGIGEDNITDYLKSGAVAVGLGSTLVPQKASYTKEDLKNLKDRTESLVRIIKADS